MTYKGQTDLTATVAHALFRDAMERELARAIEPYQERGVDRSALVPASRFWSGVYWQAHRSIEDLQQIREAGFSTPDGSDSQLEEGASDALRMVEAMRREVEEECLSALQRAGVAPNPGTLEQALIQRLRGRAAAHERVQLAADPRISSREDILGALLDEALIAAIRNGVPLTATATTTQGYLAGSIYLEQDTRRFSEVIEETIAAIQATNKWNGDVEQRRRIMKSFAWVTCDKRLCDYRPSDVVAFKAALVRLPTTFEWKRHFDEPYQDVIDRFPLKPVKNKRSDRTINRDLSTMARVSTQLARSSWKRADGAKELVLDFSDHSNEVSAEDPNDPDRLPWTEEQLKIFFSSPVYTGGGGGGRRLRPSKLGTVWQDAAYWVPLIAAYAYMSREEICGLEVGDVVFDVAIPYFKVQPNRTKARFDEGKAGIKSANRRRIVPIHPELLRLGFEDYVAKIYAEKHACIFPELYMPDEKTRGGKKFYARAFIGQVDAVDAISALPETSKGKSPDLHSIRTFGASHFELADTKQLIIDRLLGHAPSGTGPRRYSRASFAVEIEVYLEEFLAVLIRVAPNVTGHLKRAPLRLLPLKDRSRTGSAPGRNAALSKADRRARGQGS